MEDMAFFYGIIPVKENLTVAVANIQQRQFSGLRIFLVSPQVRLGVSSSNLLLYEGTKQTHTQ